MVAPPRGRSRTHPRLRIRLLMRQRPSPVSPRRRP
jgi:hypothetical protein